MRESSCDATVGAYDDPPLLTLGPATRGRVRRWLLLAVSALLAAGLLALLLVAARAPWVRELIPGGDFFRVVLVVHVNLSVLVWFMSFAALLWGLCQGPGRWLDVGFALAAGGVAAMLIAPFLGAARPHLNNYVPVVESRWFFAGLGAFAIGVLTQALGALAGRGPGALAERGLAIGLKAAAALSLAAAAVLLWSYARLPAGLTGEGRYEVLFWGAGHLLQFNHTLTALVVWILLLQAAGGRWRWGPGLTAGLLSLAALPALYAVYIETAHPLDSLDYRRAYTALMSYGGLAALPAGLLVLDGLRTLGGGAARAPLRAALLASLLLFASGGVIGFLIEGVNVVIPAHYHGSIVGVTLAFMGLSFYLLPRLGYAAPGGRLAHWQPYVYGGGQLLHVLGLAWSGGYGVQRKAIGAEQALERWQELAGMSLMGLGGLIAVIGGLLYVVVVLRCLRRTRATAGCESAAGRSDPAAGTRTAR